MTRQCANTGNHVLAPTVPHGTAMYPVKAMVTPRRCWYCPMCGRRAWARLVGQRGGWWFEFESHPARGVTKAQWQRWQEAR